MHRTSSDGSNDFDYSTRASSVTSSTLQQSYPIQSYSAQSYVPTDQLSQQSKDYSYGNQRSPNIEVVRASPVSSSSPSEYPCLHHNCGHISSRAHDLKVHMTTHFPPSVNELLDCEYKWCGRTGTHGFKREDDRKEHYRKLHGKENEYPKNGKGRRSRGRSAGPLSRVASSSHSVGLENLNPAMQFLGVNRKPNVREESMPPSGDLHASRTSEKAAAPLGYLQPPKTSQTLLDQAIAGSNVSVPHSDVVIAETLDADNDRPVEYSITTSEEKEMLFYEEDEEKKEEEEEEPFPSSEIQGVHERLGDGIFDGSEARVEGEQRHSTKAIPEKVETSTDSIAPHRKQEKLTITRSQILENLSTSEAGHFCASLEIQWDILGFMKNQFCDDDFPNSELGPVITITGSAQHAQATICSDYVKQYWPKNGSKVLGALQAALDSPTHRSYSSFVALSDDRNVSKPDVPSGRVELAFDITQGQVSLFIKSGSPEIIVDAVQQLAWMGAALRTSRDGRIQYCESKLDRIREAKGVESTLFNITFDMSSPSKEDQSCWFLLFANPVIARGFPTAHRNHDEVGLEVPLEMMAALGGVRHAVDFEGGLVLKGHSTLFVPTKCHEASVQWHMIRVQGEGRLSYREASVQCPDRALLKDLNHDSLGTARAYLGWWKKAETYLGTVDADYESIDWSPAGEAKRSAKLSGANIGFQTMVTGQLNFVMGAKDGKLHFSQKGPFQKTVQSAAKTPVALYDLGDRRAWLVPALDVMLHVVQTRHHMSPYSSDGRNVKLTSIDPENGRDAAIQAVVANQSRQLYEPDIATEKGYYFKDAILDIWSQIEGLMDKKDAIEASTGLALHGTMQKKVRGWEYMSLVHEKNYRRKEATIAKSSGGWVDLIGDIDALVLFATGLGEIIRPVSDLSNLCRPWRSLPKGKDYLASGVPMLEQLYSEAGSRLSRKHLSITHLQWHRGFTLFEQCNHIGSNQRTCDRTQQIYHDSLFKTFGSVRPPGKLEANGCVVFGQMYHPFKPPQSSDRRQNPIYMLQNSPIQNGESVKQISTKDNGLLPQSPAGSFALKPEKVNGLLSPSPPASVSTEPEDVNGCAFWSPKSPPSSLSSTDGLGQENAVASKRGRKTSHAGLSKSDAGDGSDHCSDEISSISDHAVCPTEYQSMFLHKMQFRGQGPTSTPTACASDPEYTPAYKKAKIEGIHSHRHGYPCTSYSTMDFEASDSSRRQLRS